MQYATIPGVERKISSDLYDPVELEELIEDTSDETVSWIDNSTRQLGGFSTEDLDGDDSIIRLAACCYSAFRLMSFQLEGHDINTESLAVFRYEEAKTLVRQWCSLNGIIPSFDDIFVPSPGTDITPEVGTSFASAYGSDAICIGTSNQ